MNHAVSAERPDWMSAPVEELIDHIVGTHHAYLRRALPQLTAAAAAAAGSEETLRPLQSTLLDLRGELESHMWKEEMVLFPLIRTMLAAERAGAKPPPAHCGSVNNPIRVMRHEHDSATGALEQMRRFTGGYSLSAGASEACRSLYQGLQELETDLITHIHLENDILFPRAADLELRLA